MLQTFAANHPLATGLLKLSLNPTGVGIRHTANGAPMHADFHFRFDNVHILSDIP